MTQSMEPPPQPTSVPPTAAVQAAKAGADAAVASELQAATHRPAPTINRADQQPVSSYEALLAKWLGHAEGAGHIFVAALFTYYAAYWLLDPAAAVSWTATVVRLLVLGPGLALGVTAVVLQTTHRRYMDTVRRNIKADLQRGLFRERLVTDNPLDRESAEWVNHILHRFWLIFEPVISDIVVSSVDPILDYYKPASIDQVKLSEFTLGTVPPRVLWSKAYPCTDDPDLIRFDMAVSFVPAPPDSLSTRKGERNSRIVLSTRLGRGVVGVDVPVLVSDCAFEGEIKIQLHTMAGFPYIKTASVQFPTSPHIDFVLKPLKGMDLMDLPGLSSFVHSITNDIIGWLFVAPNAFTLDLDAMLNGDGSWAGNETACGVLMVRVIEAKDLKNMERTGFSDPYADIKVRGRTVAKTRVIPSNLHPYWDETFYLLVHSLEDIVECVVYDKEGTLKDKVMGSMGGTLLDLGIDSVVTSSSRAEDVWRPLTSDGKGAEKWKMRSNSDVKTLSKSKGEIHLDLAYYPVMSSALADIPVSPVVAEAISDKKQPDVAANDSNVTWAGILRITVHQAKELDEGRANIGQLNPFVEIRQSGTVVHSTKIKKRTNNPAWSDLVELFVRHPATEKLQFAVRDKRDFADPADLGYCEVNVADVLAMHGISANPHHKRDPALPAPKVIEWWNLRNAKCGKLRVTFAYTPVPFDHPLPSLNAAKNLAPAIGVLRLKVVEARGLKNQEVTGMSDPYVNVLYGGAIRGKTHVVESTLEPLWHEVVYVLVRDSSLRGLVSFEIYDYNNLRDDKLMGKSHYDLKALSALKFTDVTSAWLPVSLDNGKKSVGELRVEFSYYPITKEHRPATIITNPKTIVHQRASTGILRVNVKQIELDEKSLLHDGFDERSPPSPYLEFLDTRGAITGNEVAVLADTNMLRVGGGQGNDSASDLPMANSGSKLKPSKSSQALAQALLDSDQQKEAESHEPPRQHGRDISLLYRTVNAEKSFSGRLDETMEFFVKDLDSARLVVLCKDHAVKKDHLLKDNLTNLPNLTGGGSFAQSVSKHTVLGKTELNIKSLLSKAKTESMANVLIVPPLPEGEAEVKAGAVAVAQEEKSDEAQWFKIFALNLNRPSIVGKFQLSLEYHDVEVDEQLLLAEQDAEATNSGTVQVCVVDAENLPAVDSSGTSDPYCKVSLNNAQILKTKVVKKNCVNPRWNETCSVPCQSRAHSRLHFDVRDWDKIGQSTVLGLAHVDCVELVVGDDDKPTPMTVNLLDESGGQVFGPNGATSKLHLELLFIPDTESTVRRRHLKNKRSLPSVGGAVEDAIGAVGAVGLAARRFVTNAAGRSKASNRAEQAAKTAAEATPPVTATPDTLAAAGTATMAASNQSLTSAKSIKSDGEMHGALTITVVEAKNLKAVDTNGLSDPYVKVRYFSKKDPAVATSGKHSRFNVLASHHVSTQKFEKVLFKTKVMKKSLSPVWNESFIVPFSVSPEDGPLSLNFCIKDHNLMGSGVEIGECDVDVWQVLKVPSTWAECQDYTQADFWTTETLRGGGEGSLHLKFEFQKTLDAIAPNPLSRSATSLFSFDGADADGSESQQRKRFGQSGRSNSMSKERLPAGAEPQQ